jgi:methylated-DNA-[protein]-cysteine S-methyltransferase
METIYIGDTGKTPLGDLWLAVSDAGLVAVEFDMGQDEFGSYVRTRFKRPVKSNPKRVAKAAGQLRDYLSGKRRSFTFPIDWSVLRPFQRLALEATYAIPYGETRTYGELAHQIGRPRAARAVGRAEATNPMPLVIPCHRVVGTDGKLHGYGGGEGLPTKEWLLKLEGAVLA